jgi:L-threonylcarbamoyladenylate synthase
VIGQWPGLGGADAPRVSGALASHYAPRTPVVLVDGAALPALQDRLAGAGRRAAMILIDADAASKAGAVTVLPAQPDGYAQGLYAALRSMDSAGADVILVQRPPQHTAWLGINDRLRRAAHGSENTLAMLGL